MRLSTNGGLAVTRYTVCNSPTKIVFPTDIISGRTMDENSLLCKVLAGELHYAKLWLVCVALRGVAWDKMPFEQRELAFQAKDAASNCLAIFLNSQEYRCACSRTKMNEVLNIFPGLPFGMPSMTASSLLLSLVFSSSKWPTFSPPSLISVQ